MTPSLGGDPALDVLTIVESSETFRPLVAKHPDLRTLLIDAAEAAGPGPYRARLIEALTAAASASDKRLEIMCSGGDAAEFEKWTRIASAAGEDLGRVLKQLCPSAPPIGQDVTHAPN